MCTLKSKGDKARECNRLEGRTDAEAGKVLRPGEVGGNGAHAVVAAVAALGTQPHHAARQVQVIVHHQHPLQRHLL